MWEGIRVLVPIGSHTFWAASRIRVGRFLGWGPGLIASSFPPCSLGAPAPCVPMVGVGVSSVLRMAVPATPVISCPPLGLDQLKALQKSYGRLQQDVLQFQKNQTNLERKFSYDL